MKKKGDYKMKLTFKTIEEFEQYVSTLGDWKDESTKKEFFIVLANLAAVYNGYETQENGKTTTGYFPNSTLKAMIAACQSKFPSEAETNQIFTPEGDLRPGYPTYSNYLSVLHLPYGVSLLAERTNLDKIAREELELNIRKMEATESEIKTFIESCEKYLATKEQENAANQKQ